MLFAAKQLQENCQEQYVDLYFTFVDLTRAGEQRSENMIWRIMAKYGCPSKFSAVVRQLHDGMLVRVQDNRETSKPFLASSDVPLHQPCSVLRFRPC